MSGNVLEMTEGYIAYFSFSFSFFLYLSFFSFFSPRSFFCVRGGGFDTQQEEATCFFRKAYLHPSNDLGFRCAKDV